MVNRVKGTPLAAASFPPSSFFPLLGARFSGYSIGVRFDVDLSSLEPIVVAGDVSVKFSTRLISVEGSGEFRSRRVFSFYER